MVPSSVDGLCPPAFSVADTVRTGQLDTSCSLVFPCGDLKVNLGDCVLDAWGLKRHCFQVAVPSCSVTMCVLGIAIPSGFFYKDTDYPLNHSFISIM